MANEFIIKKGLVVKGASGGTVVNVLGSQGQLLSVTDNLSGSIFAVSDISGVPIFDVNSSGLVTVDGPFTQTGGGTTILSGTLNVAGVSTLANVGYLGDGLGSVQYTLQSANDGYGTIDFGDVADSNIGRLSYNHNDNSFLIRTNNSTALTLDSSQNAVFEGTITAGIGTQAVNNDAILNVRAGSGAFAGIDIFSPRTTGNIGGLRFLSTSSDSVPEAQFLVEVDGEYNFYNGTNGADLRFTIQADGESTFTGLVNGITPTANANFTTKQYVDGLITGATIYRGTWDPDVSLNSGYGNPDLSGVTQTSGYYYICSADGAATPNGTGCEPDSWNVGDWVIWNDDVVDCAGTGTGAWQKIDNSSVISGAGDGQTVALWEGTAGVGGQETLGNAPITISSNDATFAGAGAFAGTLSAPFVTASNPNGAANGSPQEVARFVNVSSGATSAYMYIGASAGTDWRLGKNILGTSSNSNFGIAKHSGSVLAMEIDGSNNTTFAGTGTFGGSGDFGGSVNIGSGGDLILTASSGSTDTGDIVFYHTAAEAHRLWSGTNTLNYRTGGGTTYSMLHSGNYTDYNAYTTLSASTRSAGDNTVNVATTEFVTAAVASGVGNYLPVANPTFTGALTGPYADLEYIKLTAANPGVLMKETDVTDKNWDIQVNGGNLKFYEVNDARSVFSEKVTFKAGGNVGIGATDPASKLSVGGSASGFATAMQVWQDGETAASGDIGGKAATFFGESGVSNSSIVNIYSTNGYTGQNGGEIGFGGKYASGGNVAQFAKIRSFKTNASNGGVNYGGGLEFWTRPNGSSAVPRMTILGEGNVGIGTTSPPVKFVVNNGTARTSTAKTYSTFVHTNDADDFRIGLATAVKGGTTANDRYVSLEGASYRLSTDTFTNEFDLVLNPIAGNVGIGTSTPNAKLDIQGTQGQLFSVTDDLSGSIFAVSDISGVPIFDVNSSGVSYFDGNVGIGDSTPATNLSVVGSIGTDDIFMTSTAASSAGTAFVVNEATQLVTRTAAQVLSDIGAAPATSGGYLPLTGGTMTTTSKIQFYNSSQYIYANSTNDLTLASGDDINFQTNYARFFHSGVEGSRISATTNSWLANGSNGKLGVNRNDPGYNLDVSGTIRATGDVIAFSDVRVKENIKTIKNSLDKVSKLRGVEFNKIGEDEKSIGVIAQEIEKVIPEVVKTDDEGMKSVAYGNISGLLIEAIKELKAEVDLLKSKPCNCNCKK